MPFVQLVDWEDFSSLRRHSGRESQMRVDLLAGWVLLASIMGISSPVFAQASELPSLELTEVGSIRTPGLLDISSAKLLNDSTVAVLSRLHRSAWIISPTSIDAVCAGYLKTPLALAVRQGAVSVLDADHKIVTQLAGSKTRCTSQALGLDTLENVVDGVAVRTGWVATTSSRNAERFVVRFDVRGREIGRWRITSRSGGAFAPNESLTSAAGDSAIFSSTVWPFHWGVVGSNGPSRHQPTPIRAGVESEVAVANRAREDWVGLRTVALDDGFMQVLAERSGEHRAMILYDGEGVPRRSTELRAIVGALETVPDRKRLLLLRRTDRTEVVIYEWRWGAAENNPRR